MNQKGISLIEILIAGAILTTVVVAFVSLSQQATKGVTITGDRSALVRTLSVIQDEVMREMPFLPPQRLGTVNEGQIANFDWNNTDLTGVGIRCYDRFGGRRESCDGFETNNALYYRLKFLLLFSL